MLPLIGCGYALFTFDVAAAHEAARTLHYLDTDITFSQSWGALFSDMGGTVMEKMDAPARVAGFWRLLGTGNVLVFFGALIAELGFIMGVVGGVKQNKNATKQKQMAAAERRRK